MKKLVFIMPLMAASFLASCANSKNEFTVTWKNYDGSILEVDENVAKGTTPSYDGLTPLKKHDEQFSYHFKGWDNDITKEVTEDTIFIAQYEKEQLGEFEFQIDTNNTYIVKGIGTYTATDFTIPSTYNNLPVTKIRDGAFKDNTAITSLEIAPNLKEIGIKSFYACPNLRSVILTDTLTNIHSSAFRDCTSLTFVDMSMFNRGIAGDMLMFDNCDFIEEQSIKLKDQEMLELYQNRAFFEDYAEYMYI